MKRITPLLWFGDKAGEATKFYLGVFKDSKLMEVMRKENQLEAMVFRLYGQELVALNSSSASKLTSTAAFHVTCKTQREIDILWAKLSEGGSKGECGWVTDKYGVAWLVVPRILGDLMRKSQDAKQKERVWDALMGMSKIDIKALKQAANQKN